MTLPARPASTDGAGPVVFTEDDLTVALARWRVVAPPAFRDLLRAPPAPSEKGVVD